MRTECIIAAFVLVGSASTILPASTRRVPEDHATIQAAIDAAVDGDTVVVAPGTYELDKPLDYHGRAISLESAAGADQTTLRMGKPLDPLRGAILAFEVAAPAEAALEGFTLTGGKGMLFTIQPNRSEPVLEARVGGAVYIGPHATVRLSKNVFRENEAEFGGGVYCDVESETLILSCEFTDNATAGNPGIRPHRGGAIYSGADSVISIAASVFLRNRSFQGAAVYGAPSSQLEVLSSRFEGNEAEDDGGGIFSVGFQLRVFTTHFIRNRSAASGGGIRVNDQMIARPFILTIEDSEFLQNEAAYGAGVTVGLLRRFPPAAPNVAKVAFCHFAGNRATRRGGGLSIAADSGLVPIDTCTFEDNSAQQGGGVSLDYESTNDLRNCTFLRNQALRGGGLSGEEEDQTVLTNCTFLGNCAQWAGGGVAFLIPGNRGRQLSHCTIVGNAAGNGDAGLSFSSEPPVNALTVESCILWGNSGKSNLPPGDYSFSCVESTVPLEGIGNIQVPPQFAGWPGPEEIFIDPKAPPSGDGSTERPFQDLRAAVSGFQLNLLPGSPCIGTAKDGTSMGAPLPGLPAEPGRATRKLRLAFGNYSMQGISLANGVSLIGAGPNFTTVVGPVLGLSTGARLEALRVQGGSPGCISIAAGEAPFVGNTIATGGHPEWLGYAVYQLADGFTGGFGVYCAYNSAPTFDHCTIAGNWSARSWQDEPRCDSDGGAASGVYSVDAHPVIRSSIVAGNLGGPIQGAASLSYSLVDGPTPWPGEGNLAGDPHFAGWPSSEARVDAAAPEGGDGSMDRPFRELEAAMSEFDLSLTRSSPAADTGADGTDMGASLSFSDRTARPERVLFVGPGTYEVPKLHFALGLSVQGAGKDQTKLLGSVGGLRTGSYVADVTIESGDTTGGVMAGPCQSPEVRSTRVQRCVRGLTFLGGSPRVVACEIVNCYFGIAASPKTSLDVSRTLHQSNNFGAWLIDTDTRFVNCVFEGNYAGVEVYNAGRVKLLHSTLVGHYQRTIECAASDVEVQLTSCIIWKGEHESSPCSVEASSLTQSPPKFYRLPVLDFGRYESVYWEGENYVFPNTILTPGDYHLLPSSPAVDLGLAEGAPDVDFDGNPRLCGARPDAGAYELPTCGIPLFRRGDTDSSGELQITDPIALLGFLFLGGTEPLCQDAADADDNGQVQLTDAIRILTYLYVGESPPEAPFSECGEDPTPDELPCLRQQGCF